MEEFKKRNFLLTEDLISVIQSMENEQVGLLLKNILKTFDNIEILESNLNTNKSQIFKKMYLANPYLHKKNTALYLGVSRQSIYNWIKNY
jgi:hypothetical protein